MLQALLLFYSAGYIFTVAGIGIANGNYETLASSLVLLPAGFFFLYTLIENLAQTSSPLTSPLFLKIRRAAFWYSTVIVLLFSLAQILAISQTSQVFQILLLLPLPLALIREVLSFENLLQFRLHKVLSAYKLMKRQKQAEKYAINLEGIEPLPADLLPVPQLHPPEAVEPEAIALEPVSTDVTDARRRQFLKILGGGGASLVLMLFFMPHKAHAAFFGSTPGPGIIGLKDSSGNKIDPAEKNPTDGYSVSEIDDSTFPAYYGFVHKTGAWYIAREANTGAYRYVKGGSGFSTNWTNRASLSYDYFDNVF